ncbi:hypothetical protein Tco_0823876 [Tanacetum coccineum]|uniref:Uncharacterized protein n=1 Tax=Tanacetum coccineum TaxID=301880 RepID=A0ABQ5AM75_9ASTR
MLVSTSIIFPSTNSIEYLVSIVDGTMSLKGQILAEVRLLSTRFHVLAIIVSKALTSSPSEVLSKLVAKALDDATRQAFEEEKRNITSQKRAAQATSINKLSYPYKMKVRLESICKRNAAVHISKGLDIVVIFLMGKKRQLAQSGEEAMIMLRFLQLLPGIEANQERDSPFVLEAFSVVNMGCPGLDRKSTTGGCQFLGRRLISWQCKKQTIMANSTIEAEYVAAANCCGQVLWIQNQMMDYGFNFMNTKNYILNNEALYRCYQESCLLILGQ